ncbi:LOW QUALITY PROTEIN: uncharacterized protein LOC109863157 [Pseudomyrmex gracilis]|uniref:LOW QUALITY PROTEIN: uncharacterized protein LOC109863157 n=1 Tax=Pseudomyrmex gracilis TaxID=219809 RepID=UPI000995AF7D|nr:LOW QUALITY PROTEIN: uncharacterized protein LOC109863157 [Pseudomyrmex gracilis]
MSSKTEVMSERSSVAGDRELGAVNRDKSRELSEQFVDFATRTTKYFKQIICNAHNAKTFDAQFIQRYIAEKRVELNPRVILNGTKIVILTVGRTKFIDSINYMPMQLSALPKAFGLRDRLEKGYFPHLFNTLANQSYVGPLPAVEYYSPDSMSSKERERFLSWHAEQTCENAVFDFQREIVRYCHNDIDILRRACMAFRIIFLERGNGKLLFALCRSCCKNFSQTQCSHDNPCDREFEEVWVSCELRKAVKKGYLVTAQEASGWSSECVDEQSKERYFREYEAIKSIALDRANIAQNPGLRSVAKLCLNSFWGKFGQRSNLTSTEVVKS